MANRIQRDTVKAMLAKLQARLDSLYEEQESLKGVQEMPCGGKVKGRIRKMQPGGKVPKMNIAPKITAGLGEVTPQKPNPFQNPTKRGVNKIIRKEWWDSNKSTFGNIGYGLASAAPILYNAFQGMRKPDLLNPRDYYNPYRNQAMSLMANRRFNVDPLLQANRAAQANYSRNVIDASGGSRAQVLGGLGAGLNQRMAGDASVLAHKQNVDLGYQGEQAQFMYGAGQDMSNIDFSVAGMNQEAKAARRGYLGQATSDLSRWAQTNRLMKNQMSRDEQLMDILPDMFGDVAQFMPWSQDYKVNTNR